MPLVNSELVNRTFLLQVFRAAKSIVLELNIRDGDELAYVLGQPDASTNKEAVELWLLSRIDEGDIDLQRYSELKAELFNILEELTPDHLY